MWSELSETLSGPDSPVGLALVREMIDLEVVGYITVEGEPASKARARYNAAQRRAYTPEKTLVEQERVAWSFRQAVGPRTINASDGYGVFVVFFCESRQRRDVDNMLKLVMDGLTGVAWVDDKQVTEVSARIVHDVPDPRTELVVYRTIKRVKSSVSVGSDAGGRRRAAWRTRRVHSAERCLGPVAGTRTVPGHVGTRPRRCP
jgi:Holliday junction resolvase RusA-like endonuclease